MKNSRKLFLLWNLLLAGLILLITAGSCNGAGSFTISLGTSTISIEQGSNDNVTVTLTRNNFTNPINLSLEGTVAGITGTFTPNPVLSSTLVGNATATLTLNIAPTVAIGSYNLTVKAVGGGVTQSATLNLTVQASAVTGKVIDFLGDPRVGLLVKIGTGIALTDASGNFSITGVTPPYDAIVIDTTGSTSIGYVFQGLTRTDPTLQTFAFPSTVNSATIQGNLTGGAGFPNPANHVAWITFGSPEGFGFDNLASGSGPVYNMTPGWVGPPATSGNLHALQWKENASNLPIDYTGYGSVPLTISNGGTFSSPQTDIALSTSVAEATLSGSASLPGGYTVDRKFLSADWGVRQSIPVVMDNTPGMTFSYTTPNLPGTTMNVVVRADAPAPSTGNSVTYLTNQPPNASGVNLTVPPIPGQILPADGVTGVDTSTNFSWQAFTGSGGAVHAVIFNFTSAHRSYLVVTKGSSTTIPDLAAAGLPLPASAAGSWQVIGVSPFTDVDAATGPGGFLTDAFLTTFALMDHDGSFGSSGSRGFTTAP